MRLNRAPLLACFAVALTLAFQLTVAKAQPDTLKQIVPGAWLPLQVHDTWREITEHKPAGALKNGE